MLLPGIMPGWTPGGNFKQVSFCLLARILAFTG
jgi:hypothetical protein